MSHTPDRIEKGTVAQSSAREGLPVNRGALLARAQAGDREAVTGLLKVVRPRMLRGIQSVLQGYRQEEEVEEVLQAAYLGFLEGLSRIESADALLAFAYSVGCHRAGRFLDKNNGQRKDRVRVALLDGVMLRVEEEDSSPERQVERRLELHRLRLYLKRQLSQQAFQVYELLMEQELSASEVAERLGITANYVHQMTYNIRKLARGFLRHRMEPPDS